MMGGRESLNEHENLLESQGMDEVGCVSGSICLKSGKKGSHFNSMKWLFHRRGGCSGLGRCPMAVYIMGSLGAWCSCWVDVGLLK